MHTLESYQRQRPPEWDTLLRHAPPVWDDGTSPLLPTYALLRRAWKLPGLALEQNYYHGIGNIMWALSERLHDPEYTAGLVMDAAKEFVRVSVAKRPEIPMDEPFRPTVGDLMDEALDLTFTAAARQALAALPPKEQTLANTLTTATLNRRAAMSKDFGPMVCLRSAGIARRKQQAAGVVGNNVLSGSIAVFCLHTMRKIPAHVSAEDLAKPLNVVDAAFLHQGTFIPPARLRLDEFTAGVGLVTEGEGQAVRFDTNVLRQPPGPIIPQAEVPLLRTERLSCQALRVGTLVSKAALEILPAIITTAQQLVPHNVIGDGQP